MKLLDRPKITSVSKYLKGVRSYSRGQIRTHMRRLATERGCAPPSGVWRANPAIREVLHDAIFEVENDLESRCGGQSDHSAVVEMRRARNLVLDDLGWNEYQ